MIRRSQPVIDCCFLEANNPHWPLTMTELWLGVKIGREENDQCTDEELCNRQR
jgi:hypothetical protein